MTTHCSASRSAPAELSAEDAEVFAVLARTWQPVARSSEVSAGTISSVHLLGQRLAIWRGNSGQLGAVLDRCPHRGARFGIGQVVGDELACPYHGWRFAGDGRCTAVPSLGPVDPPAGFAITRYAVRERFSEPVVKQESFLPE